MTNVIRSHKSNSKDKDAERIAFGLSQFQPGSIISEMELAVALGKHPASIKRAVEHGQLPPPVIIGKHTCLDARLAGQTY